MLLWMQINHKRNNIRIMIVVSFVVNMDIKKNGKCHTWRAKEVTVLVLVCSEVDLASLPNDILVGSFWCYCSHKVINARLSELPKVN